MVNHVAVCAALGEPRRAHLIGRLSATDATVSQLAEEISISLPATLKHLGVLEEAGLIRRVKHGRVVTVSLRPEALEQTEAWLHRLRMFWTSQLGHLAASFTTPPPSQTPEDSP